jgi:regulatory protein
MGRRGPSGRRETPQEARERRVLVDDPQAVTDVAIRFLEARPRSVAEVRRRLSSAGYRSDLVEVAIVRLTEVGLLDDREFARMWVRSRDASRPRGEQALRREMLLKGIDPTIVATVLEERTGGSDGDDVVSPDRAAAARLLERRGAALSRGADPAERRRRAYALLARNGFDPEVCAEAARAFAGQE